MKEEFLKKLVKAISKAKRKRKNKKSKKKKAVEPLQNNKPNFGHQNQIGGGGGGIGGTSYNPFNQPRSAPAVTTVVNTPSSGGQNGGQNNTNPLSTAGLVKEEKFLQLTNDFNTDYQNFKNKTERKLNTIKNHSRNLEEGFNILARHTFPIQPLSIIQSGSFRQP